MLLAIQFDEFQGYRHRSTQKFKLNGDFLFLIAQTSIRNHKIKICLLPYLTGTATELGLNSISLSRMTSCLLLLQRLKDDDFETTLKNYATRKNSNLSINVLTNPIVKAAIDSLGGNPRNLQFFCQHLQEPSLGKYSDFISQALFKTVTNLDNSYFQKMGKSTWRKFTRTTNSMFMGFEWKRSKKG